MRHQRATEFLNAGEAAHGNDVRINRLQIQQSATNTPFANHWRSGREDEFHDPKRKGIGANPRYPGWRRPALSPVGSPYERSVYFVSLSRLGNEEEAEDVAQETFIAAFRDLSAFRGSSNFSVWLFGIALNLAGNRLRTKGINRIAARIEVQDELMPVPPALLSGWRRLGSESVEREEIRSLLQLAINELPEVYLQVTFLRDVEKLNSCDTAQILNITSSQVKATLHRSRMMLQRLLAPGLKAINK